MTTNLFLHGLMHLLVKFDKTHSLSLTFGRRILDVHVNEVNDKLKLPDNALQRSLFGII